MSSALRTGSRAGALAWLALACHTVPGEDAGPAARDWLVDPAPFVARSSIGAGEIVLENGLARRVWRVEPELACVALDDLVQGSSLLRALEPEATLTLDGATVPVGGLVGRAERGYLRPEELAGLRPDPAAFRFVRASEGPIEARMAWRRGRGDEGRPWPPRGRHLVLEFRPPDGVGALAGVRVLVHHELYDGLPLFGKWIEVQNEGSTPHALDRYESERLAAVEGESYVERRERWTEPALLAFTDYSMGAKERCIAWLPDPAYTTQVNYRLETPCLLVSRPPLGPAQTLAPGGRFVSHRTWELLCDSTERERNGLALRRAMRTLAPWSTENPLILHARSAAPDDVRLAIDQAADVGFELVILSFGSGFDCENEDPAYVAEIRALADYAHSKDIELGGYSLLASRRISDEHDVVDPGTGTIGHAIFGNSPCLGSRWGADYFRKLTAFFTATGLDALEHDGNYPGDVCASTAHPGHVGLADSQWTQWKRITDFYAWTRERGLYSNVPDLYFLSGANKTAMGYRETNWSLPRVEQLLHARQNIYDGTWEKAPSMGWMFVPLVEYQGGGAAATIEPLAEHLDTYAAFLDLNLGAGVQACWRGPRLYDAPETRALVVERVRWFKEHRAILESDVIHLRRPDGRDWDGLMHVNPALETRALAMLFNPFPETIERTIRLPLYYAGLTDDARVRIGEGPETRHALDRGFGVTLSLPLAPGMTAIAVR